MSTTYGELKTALANMLRDPDSRTFTDTDLGDMVNQGLVEISRLAPREFSEDIAASESALSYAVLYDEFPTPEPDVVIQRVEIWDGGVSPHVIVATVDPLATEYSLQTDAGWNLWGGTLYLPASAIAILDEDVDNYYLKVYGYAPYPEPLDDAEAVEVNSSQKWALLSYARLEALERLNSDRDLYTQWQTRSGVSDISPAGLMNMLVQSRDEWRRRAQRITRLRVLG